VILESLHRELPVHGTPKGSGPFDPTHREPLDLMCEFPFREFGDSDTGDWKDREQGERLHRGFPNRESR
jgi:hypothetical protein